MKILITGATGLIGKRLVNRLKEKGHYVNILVRNKTENPNEFCGIQPKIPSKMKLLQT